MKTSDALDVLQSEVRKVADSNGQINPQRLIAFLGQLKDQFKTTDGGSPVVPTEAKLERYKAELSNFFDQERRRHEWDVELFKSVIQSGQIALRSCILVNGVQP